MCPRIWKYIQTWLPQPKTFACVVAYLFLSPTLLSLILYSTVHTVYQTYSTSHSWRWRFLFVTYNLSWLMKLCPFWPMIEKMAVFEIVFVVWKFLPFFMVKTWALQVLLKYCFEQAKSADKGPTFCITRKDMNLFKT